MLYKLILQISKTNNHHHKKINKPIESDVSTNQIKGITSVRAHDTKLYITGI